MRASSSVLDLIATQSVGFFFVFISYPFSFWKKNHSDLSKSTSKHLYLFILSEKFLQIKVGGGQEGRETSNKKKLRPNQFAFSFCAAHVMTELLTLKFFSGAVLWKKKQINKQTKRSPWCKNQSQAIPGEGNFFLLFFFGCCCLLAADKTPTLNPPSIQFSSTSILQ